MLPKLVSNPPSGLAVGVRNYWSPETKEELAQSTGVELLAPYYLSKKRNPAPERSAYLSRLRYRIDTGFSQLTERYSIRRGGGRRIPGTRLACCSGRSSATPSPSCSTTERVTILCNSLSSSTKNPHLGLDASFHEKAYIVKANLTVFACRRRIRLRRCPRGSGMAQG